MKKENKRIIIQNILKDCNLIEKLIVKIFSRLIIKIYAIAQMHIFNNILLE